MPQLIGELAALSAAFLWSINSIFFTLAGRNVGSMIINRTRLLLAVLFLVAAHLVLGQPLPFNVSGDRWLWLGLSGVIGLTLGDAFLFQAFLMIGPRLSMLLMALAPVLSALLAWPIFGETLKPLAILGMVVTLAGVVWVVLEQNGQPGPHAPRDRRTYLIGILCGLGGATGQALGLITAKEGLSGDFPALTATLIRMLVATAAIWLYTMVRGQAGYTFRQLGNYPKAFWLIVAGAVCGPFLGVTASLIAVQRADVGIASTLMAVSPVILLPISYFYFHERFGRQAILGTLLAIAGVALLFLI